MRRFGALQFPVDIGIECASRKFQSFQKVGVSILEEIRLETTREDLCTLFGKSPCGRCIGANPAYGVDGARLPRQPLRGVGTGISTSRFITVLAEVRPIEPPAFSDQSVNKIFFTIHIRTRYESRRLAHHLRAKRVLRPDCTPHVWYQRRYVTPTSESRWVSVAGGSPRCTIGNADQFGTLAEQRESTQMSDAVVRNRTCPLMCARSRPTVLCPAVPQWARWERSWDCTFTFSHLVRHGGRRRPSGRLCRFRWPSGLPVGRRGPSIHRPWRRCGVVRREAGGEPRIE